MRLHDRLCFSEKFYVGEIEKVQKCRLKQMKKVLSYILPGGIIIVMALFFLRLRGSVAVKPGGIQWGVGEVAAYRQDDEVWAEDMLGDSRFTMRSSGCLVTCIASAVSMETGKEMTPGALNQVFSENHVYDSEGNIQWAAIDEIQGYRTDVFLEVSGAEIAQCLATGHYPVVRVRMHGIGSFHYVLIVGSEDGEYVCMDPLEDGLTRLSDYLNRVYAVRAVWKIFS